MYSITFMSYAELDKTMPWITKKASCCNKLSKAKRRKSTKIERATTVVCEQEPNNVIIAHKNFSNSVFIFIIQFTLLFLVFSEFNRQTASELTYEVFLTRIICAALLHMQLESEIRQSIHMLNYARMMVFHDEFRRPMIAASIMQFFGSFGTEVVSIILICN